MFRLLKKFYAILLLLVLICITSTIGHCDGKEIMTGGRLVKTDIVSEVPIEFFGYNMLVKVKINNSAREYTFILDTGSDVIIDKKVAQEFNDAERFNTIASDATNVTQKGEIIQLKSLKVGDIEVENCGANIFDLGQIESFGIKVDGILGDNFLKFLLIKIDYSKKVLTLSGNTENYVRPNRGYGFSLMRRNGRIFAWFTLGSIGFPSMVMIDTGATGEEYMDFPYKFLEMLKPELNCKSITSIGSGVVGLFGQTESIYSRLTVIKLGNFKATNIPVQFADSYSIRVTNAFLAHFIVTINYPQSKIYLEPNGKVFETNIKSFGFMAKKDDMGKIRIIGLWKGSPAQKAGLKVGNEISDFRIGGQSIGFEDIIAHKYDQDISLSFQVVNGSRKREVTLKKANLLPEL